MHGKMYNSQTEVFNIPIVRSTSYNNWWWLVGILVAGAIGLNVFNNTYQRYYLFSTPLVTIETDSFHIWYMYVYET